MHVNSRVRALLLLVALAGAGFAVGYHLLVRRYQAVRDRDDATLQYLQEAFGNYETAPRLFRGMGFENPWKYPRFHIVREVRRPRWAEAALLRLPDEVFLRTTQVVVGETPCLGLARYVPAPQGDDLPPAEFSPHLARALRVLAPENDGRQQFVDWDFQRAGLQRAQAAYRELSALPELELLRPDVLFGDADLALFRNHPRLHTLCLLPPYTNDGFSPLITTAGLRQLEGGFPALKFLLVEDYKNGDSEGVDPQSLIGRLLARRPGLHIARYCGGLGLVWSTPIDPATATWRPISVEARREMDAAAPLLNSIDDNYPQLRYPGDPKQPGNVF